MTFYKIPAWLGHEEWQKWKIQTAKNYPVQYFLRETAPHFISSLKRKVNNLFYWIKCLFKPYNVLKIKTLPRSWIDEDVLLLHVSFAILERFMAQNPGGQIDWNHNKAYKKAWREIRTLWNWWKLQEYREKRERE